MNQFTQLLVLVLLSFNLHLSASEVNRTDTIGKFNEVTDIELRLKKLLDTPEKSDTSLRVLEDTIRGIQDDSLQIMVPDSVSSKIFQDSIIHQQDSLIGPASADTVQIDKSLIAPKKKQGFIPPLITTSLDALYNRNSNGTIHIPDPAEVGYNSYLGMLSYRDTMFFNSLFLPVVFTGYIENPDSVFVYSPDDKKTKGILVTPDDTFNKQIEKKVFADKVRRDYYINNPTEIAISTAKLEGLKQTATDTDIREKFNPFKELLSSQTSYSLERPDVEGTKIKRVYWQKTGNHSLQFSQNYFSPNWHRGGTSHVNINSNQIFNMNYQKEKIRFNNRIEWRLAIFSAPDDTLRDFRIGDDMIRYYGDFGLDAYKKMWSYSTNLEAKTQLFNSYQANKDDLRSAFLAPLYVNAGIGMKYNLDKRSKTVRHRRTRLAISISPLSINYKYVGNDDVNPRRYGIPEDKKSIFDKGSTLTSNMTYDINKYVSWTSRIKYFTNYSKVEAEFENTLNMSLSQYFSTKLYLHLRYDDGVPSHEDYKYLQINEVVSFGLNFKW